MAKSNAMKMYKKYPKLFMEMFLHSMEENPDHPDDNSVIFSKIMSNVTHPGNYWMPDWPEIPEILEDFKNLNLEKEE